MTLETVRAALPDYAPRLKLNLIERADRTRTTTEQQIWGNGAGLGHRGAQSRSFSAVEAEDDGASLRRPRYRRQRRRPRSWP